MSWKILCACATVSLGLAASSFGQTVVTELTAVGKPFPGTFPPFSPSSYAVSGSVATNGKGGYAISGVGGGGSTAFIWGHTDGGPPADGTFYVLSDTLPPPGLSSFLARVGLDDAGNVLFSGSNPHSLWTQAGPIAKQPDPIPAPLQSALGVSDKFYSQFLSTYGFAPNGTPVWRATYSTSAGGTPEAFSLVRGFPDQSPTVLLKSGSTVVNAPQPITTSTLASARAFNTTSVGFAPGNNNYIAEGFMERQGGVTADTDQILVVSGVAGMLNSGLVRERDVIDDPRANAGENWRNIFHADINNSGQYVFTAQTFTPGGSLAHVLANNTQLLLKQNDVLNFFGTDYSLGTQSGEVAINSSGDWAVTWSTPAGGNLLIANGQIVAAGGVTQYDIDDNGTADAILGRIGLGSDKMTMTDRFPDGTFKIYFFGSMADASREGVYSIVVPEPASLGLIGLALVPLLRRRR